VLKKILDKALKLCYRVPILKSGAYAVLGAKQQRNDGKAAAGRFFLACASASDGPQRKHDLKELRFMVFNGTVKWFNEAKGYGFIRRDDGPDLFVHYTNIVGTGFRTLKEDDKVEFEVSEGPKGLQAINVTKV
jgi:CspA family cold shock protein